ncbi:cell division ATP-binding protein FtsE [Candidatus Neomarinimicrobiota bacterium]
MIEFNNVTHVYSRGPGVFDINFRIEDGELVFLVGPSGAGKSSLLKLMYAELISQQGDITVNGYLTRKTRSRDIPYLRRTLGLIFQDFRLLPDRTAYENIALPLHIIGLTRREIRERTYSVLEDVGLTDRALHFPNELSGGEQQRIAIARAVVKNPLIILADEPTGNLDASAALETMELLTYLAEENGSTVVVATHDYTLMAKRKSRLIEIDNGRLIS